MMVIVWALMTFAAGDPADDWPKVSLPSPRDVELGGPLGEDLRRGLERLALPPYETPWILADVSFGVKRIFTNYSGDVSGRFLELASLASPRDASVPPALDAVLNEVLRYQKPDGHFGADFDLSKKFERNTTRKLAPLPMFWGNGRILVGLATAARERGRADLLEAAKKLGDYYVASAGLMCSPEREAEYRSTGTYGDSYVCDYFPAMEGLALLYQATKEEKYLGQARRMAGFFGKFDALPIDHSHGNLCAWRSFLMLYEITGDRSYLDATRAKWDAAVKGGFIWPIGGLGEHWHVKYHITEACSESDWLRLNLDLWRFTGETRYLDMAERVLHNQYRVNQCSNGGYGSRHLEADAAGPFAVKPKIDEWYFCCSFHGPLGLHFLKPYLVCSSERGIYLNFPLDCKAKVKWGGREWKVSVKTQTAQGGEMKVGIDLLPQGGGDGPWPRVWVRLPGYAHGYTIHRGDRRPVTVSYGGKGGRLDIDPKEEGPVSLPSHLFIEKRCFQDVRPGGKEISRLSNVAMTRGPYVLFASPAPGGGRPTIMITVNSWGFLGLPAVEGGFATVMLPSVDADEAAIAAAVESGPAVLLQPWGSFAPKQRAPFMFDVVVVPASALDAKKLEGIAARAAAASPGGPVYGQDLEKRRDLWPEIQGWTFEPGGLLAAGGDVGLMNAEGYRDYRFEFDLVLPAEGQGIGGWVVRARDAGHCVMFQLQSADSPFSAPEYRTKPNTLRPHLRRGGPWEILDPVPLPREVKRGESHRIAVECRGDVVEVFLDGATVHSMRVPDHREGGVGFRAAGPAEQGLFRKITLRKVE